MEIANIRLRIIHILINDNAQSRLIPLISMRSNGFRCMRRNTRHTYEYSSGPARRGHGQLGDIYHLLVFNALPCDKLKITRGIYRKEIYCCVV